jgi:hypothetical protein
MRALIKLPSAACESTFLTIRANCLSINFLLPISIIAIIIMTAYEKDKEEKEQKMHEQQNRKQVRAESDRDQCTKRRMSTRPRVPSFFPHPTASLVPPHARTHKFYSKNPHLCCVIGGLGDKALKTKQRRSVLLSKTRITVPCTAPPPQIISR